MVPPSKKRMSENETSSAAAECDSSVIGRTMRVMVKSSSSEAATLKMKKKSRGRMKIEIEFIQNKLKRTRTFSKRKNGIINKVKELAELTGTQVLLLVASETGRLHKWATPKLQPILDTEPGKSLIQGCLRSQRHNDASMEVTAATVSEKMHLSIQKASDSAGPGHARDGLRLLPDTSNAQSSWVPRTSSYAPVELSLSSGPSSPSSTATVDYPPDSSLSYISSSFSYTYG